MVGNGLLNSQESITNVVATSNSGLVFETVALQGSLGKEDYSDLCSQLINKSKAISFLSCLVDFKKMTFQEGGLDKIGAIQVRGDSELLKLGNLLDQARNLQRLEYLGISSFDQLLRYNFKERLPRLTRVCLSSYFMDTT